MANMTIQINIGVGQMTDIGEIGLKIKCHVLDHHP